MTFTDLETHLEEAFAVAPERIASAEHVARRARLASVAAAVQRYRWRQGPRPLSPRNAVYCATYRTKNLDYLRATARERQQRAMRLARAKTPAELCASVWRVIHGRRRADWHRREAVLWIRHALAQGWDLGRAS